MIFLEWELLELRALVERAFEAKGKPDFQANLEAIEAWRDRRFLARWERIEAEEAKLIALLRETDPALIVGQTAAAP